MKFYKLEPTAVGIVEIEGELTVVAFKKATIEYGEVGVLHTGICIQIEEGKVGLLCETQPMGYKGVTVGGKLVTALDLGELRVSIMNNHREAFVVEAGSPIARLLILDKEEATLEELDQEAWEKLAQELRDKQAEDEVAQKQQEMHAVGNGPGVGLTQPKSEGAGLRTNAAANLTGKQSEKEGEDKNLPGTNTPAGRRTPASGIGTPQQTGTPATT